MVLSNKFNEYFSTASVTDLMLGVYISSAYGSNAFDFVQAARIVAPTNDHAEGAEAPRAKTHLAL